MPTLPTVAQEHIPDQVVELFDTFTAEQETYRAANGKYEQKLPVTENGITKEVHEYVCPDGSIGWVAIIKAEIDGVMKCKTFGVGPETESRSHDWQEVHDDALAEIQ